MKPRTNHETNETVIAFRLSQLSHKSQLSHCKPTINHNNLKYNL